MFDRGSLIAAVVGLAKQKGIDYEDAHYQCQEWAKMHPNPNDEKTRPIFNPTKADCTVHMHAIRRRFHVDTSQRHV
jgi:hypothetical protein